MAPTTLAISLALESEKSLTIPYSSPTTAEDVCITVCKHLNIGNLAKHIFGLRAHGKYFLRPNQTIPQKLTNIEFRIRFKVANLARLKKLDGNAYNYYFHQARLDVLESKVPDIVYERHRGNVLGLSISDMFRVVMEKGISREVVERDYKKYVPKGLLRKHPFFIRRPIHNSLVRLENGLRNNPFDVEYLKAQYLIELDAIAPDYLSESYKAVMDIDGRSVSIIIKVTPPHSIEPGIKYCLQSKKEDWSLICTIEELGFVSVRNDGTIEISRLNGIPIYLKFLSILAMWSFVSLLDGYYRLTCKWTFNLCQELVSPSSKKLHSMKCHGPVGGEFSYAKLEAKTNNQAGCFIIRESESTYNTYYVDVCIKDRLGSKPKTFKLNQISDGEFLFHDDIKTYSSIIEIVQAYSDPEGAIYLKECIPPSEYDESPLLLCKTESVVGDALTDSSSLPQLISDNPVCINYKDLQVYKDGKSTGPWCYTMNVDLIDESCAVPLCSFSQCRLTGPGMEYGGLHDRGVSDRKCLKWDKKRKKVFLNGNFTSYPKFSPEKFPENSLSKARMACRNPDGDLGGPWCFVENDEQGYMEREYCDIPFCYDPECSVFAKNYETYMHYTDFNGSVLTDIKFSIKLWDSDSVNEASARLVLTVLALPLSGQEIQDLGIGIEIFITNKESALRSGRECDSWDVTNASVHRDHMYTYNNSYFAEMNATLALNYCRNPNRDVSGSWCYTKDPQAVQDVCAVRDCDRPEEFTIIVSTNQKGRRVYVLPQWKEEGLHGGLRFSLKEWNPDLLSGVVFAMFPKEGDGEMALIIGAELNEKVELYVDKKLVESKTFPHLISAGVWTDFWLQMRKGEIMFGFKGVPTALFEWRHPDMSKAFEPTFVAYHSLFDTMPIGIFFQNKECHTENTTDNNFLKYLPIGLYSEEEGLRHTNFTLKVRGVGQAWVSLMWVANNLHSYQIKIDVDNGQRKDGFRKITHVYRGMWKVTPGKKIEVALKFLNHDQEKHLKSYLNLMGQWAFLKASTIVRIFGMTFSNDVSLVTEYFKLGPLDQYLRANPSVVKPVDLIEAASNLASAVWHLKENNIVHGRIRCRKLMVHCHDDSCFNVKLTDNAVHTPYEPSEVHWIPIECYSTNKRTSAADVWALATTIYEIFSYGKEFEPADQMKLMRFYMSGKRLAQPAACPDEIYTLMTECWNEDQQKRKQPQAISRDINHLLYQVYNSRKKHAYDMLTRSSEMSSRSITSFMTDSSDCIDLYSSDDLVESATIRCESSLSNASSQQCLLPSNLNNFSSGDIDNTDSWSHLLSTTTSTFLDRDDLNWLQGIFDLDDNYEVVLKGRIGEGNYGEVYRGSLQSKSNEPTEPTLVAVKKLKASLSNTEQDFEREISIMKALKHPNIVRILGVLREPDLALVMEFVHGGCLQSSLRHEKEKFETGRLLKYASDIAMGMDYLGKKNIVHRDLAARNILVVDENHVKISDFGLAQFMDGKDYYTLRSFNRELPVKWYAPESLSEGKFSVKSDVWSYGVTLYEMFNYGESPPVLGNIDSMPEGQEVGTLIEEMTKAIGKGDRYPCPEHCPQVVYVRLMRPCWEAKPQDRPTFKDIVGELGQLMQSY